VGLGWIRIPQIGTSVGSKTGRASPEIVLIATQTWLHIEESLSETPLVTAVVATYNRANLVDNAIESILRQTYSNIEVIVVDDGSIDDTQDVLKRYGDLVRVIFQANAGPSAARNRGIAEARGEIVAFLDSDDLWHQSKIERQVEALQRAGESVPCCLCNAELCFTDRPAVSSFENAVLKPVDEEGIWSNVSEVLADRFVLFNQMAAVRRSALEKVGGFNEKLRYMEDYDLALRLSLLGPFAFIREPLVIWNQGSAGSLSAEAYQQRIRLKEIEVGIREDLLSGLDAGDDREPLKRQMRSALKKSRRRLWIAGLQQRLSWSGATVGHILDRLGRYSDAVNRRSPWFIEMKTVPFPNRSD
jgi:glycosyltransferase involved in cell wall biosynthesis